MFGYVRANMNDLTEAEQARYRSFYCGLCRALGQRHGWAGQAALTFDMTFLTIFLSSLYEPEEDAGTMRCVPHPAKPHPYVMTDVSAYAADMTIALTYHKCLDDWQDDHKQLSRAYAGILRKRYETVKEQYPTQTAVIEASLKELAEIEKQRDPSPDAAANCFGRLMASIFCMKEDYWRGALHRFGMALGKFVYLVDAACDYDKDKASGSYNPLVLMNRDPEAAADMLRQTLGDASDVLEKLPLINDINLLRNILYSGLWQTYNETMQKRKEGSANGGGSL